MVKILEVGGQHDSEEDDDCCEIDLAEFAKKVNLKAADDEVVVVAAKGPIKVKLEVDRSGKCLDTNGNPHDRAAGGCLENPYEIEEDESTIDQMESAEAEPDAKCIPVKSPVKFEPFGEVILDMSPLKCETECFEEVIADMSPVMCGPEDGNGVDELFEGVLVDMLPVKCEPEDGNGADELSKEAIPDVSQLKCEYEGFEHVVADMFPVKSEHEDGVGGDEHFAEVIPDMFLSKCESECSEAILPGMSPLKCGPEEGNSAAELFEQVIPNMSLMKSGSEGFVEVTADTPVKCEREGGNGADDHFEDVIPDMSLLKFGAVCCEEFIADLPRVKCAPKVGNGVNESVEEDAYDHLPEVDRLNKELYLGGSVFDEEDGGDVVVVGRETP